MSSRIDTGYHLPSALLAGPTISSEISIEYQSLFLVFLQPHPAMSAAAFDSGQSLL